VSEPLLEGGEATGCSAPTLGDGDPDGHEVHAIHAPVFVIGAAAVLTLSVLDGVSAPKMLRRHAVDTRGDALDLVPALLE
jgi:hypothetical protein